MTLRSKNSYHRTNLREAPAGLLIVITFLILIFVELRKLHMKFVCCLEYDLGFKELYNLNVKFV